MLLFVILLLILIGFGGGGFYSRDLRSVLWLACVILLIAWLLTALGAFGDYGYVHHSVIVR